MAKKTKTVPEQVKTSQTNSFTGGLNTDLHPLLQPNDTLTDCVNGTLITYNGNEYMLQNDMGNYALEGAELPVGYVPIGMKEHKGVVYIVSNNPQTNKTQIGSYPSPQHYSYNTSITEEDSWYNTKMDLNDQERWYKFLSTNEWNADTQFDDLTKYYYSNYLETPITSIIGNYSEESKVYPTDKYIIEDKSLDCLQNVKYNLITELGKEVDLVYNNDNNIVGTVTSTDSGWLKRTVELYSDIEYNVTMQKNDNTTTTTNNVTLKGFNANTIRLGVLHTQIEQRTSTGEGSTTPIISRNIYINENSDLRFTRSIIVTSASISVSHEFCPLIAVQQYGNWHLIIYDNKKYIDSVESQSDEQKSVLTAFQYDTTYYNDETKQYNIDCFIKLSEIGYDPTIDYTLTYLQNSLNEIAESPICNGTTTMQQINAFLKFTITCNWPDNVDFILLKVEEKSKKFEFIRPVFKNINRDAYDKEDFSTIQFYVPKVKVYKKEDTDKTYYAHCLGDNISSSNLIISDTPTNPYTTTDPEGYYGVVQKSDCEFNLQSCNANSAIVNTVLELDDGSTIILDSQYEKINNNIIKCNVPIDLILNQFNSDTEDATVYHYLGDRKYLIEEAVPKNSKDYARSITVKKVGGKQNNSVELSENSNKIKCTNTVSAQQYLTNTKFLFTNTYIYNNCNICGILYPYKTPMEIVGHVKIGVPYTEQEKLIQGVYKGKNIMCIACILSEEKETSFGNDQYRYIVPQPKGYCDKPITDRLEILALTRIYRYTNPNQIPSHKIKSGSKIITGIKYEISFSDLSMKYNSIESTKINNYIKTNYETTFDNFTYNNKITVRFLENESQITNDYIDYIENIANAQLAQDTIVYSDTLTKNTFCVDKYELNDKIIIRLTNFADRLIIFDNNIKYLADENIEYSDKCAFGGNMGTGKDELEDPAEGNGWVSIAYPIKYRDNELDLLMIKKEDDDLYNWLSNNTYSINSASPIFKNIYSTWLE